MQFGIAYFLVFKGESLWLNKNLEINLKTYFGNLRNEYIYIYIYKREETSCA